MNKKKICGLIVAAMLLFAVCGCGRAETMLVDINDNSEVSSWQISDCQVNVKGSKVTLSATLTNSSKEDIGYLDMQLRLYDEDDNLITQQSYNAVYEQAVKPEDSIPWKFTIDSVPDAKKISKVTVLFY